LRAATAFCFDGAGAFSATVGPGIVADGAGLAAIAGVEGATIGAAASTFGGGGGIGAVATGASSAKPLTAWSTTAANNVAAPIRIRLYMRIRLR
jgi:hypothetical protein